MTLGPADDLARRLRERIRREGPIPFSEFMDAALYDERTGYYATSARLGPRGDFITASDFGRAWGDAVARQLAECDRRLDRPDPFHVVEFGGGRGWLARDARSALDEEAPDLACRLRWTVVDRSAAMREAASEHARVRAPAELPDLEASVAWAVEWIDALPVDRFRSDPEGWCELRVGIDADGRFVEAAVPVPESLERSLPALGALHGTGFEVETRPGLGDAIEAVDRWVRRGFFIHVDYGDRAESLRTAARRRGTVLAYRGQRAEERILDAPGSRDLTALVDFDAVRLEAERRGWTEIGFTTQDRFLVNHGFLERFESATTEESRDPERVARRRAELALVDPRQMGRRFKVQAFARGLDPGVRLAGLTDPFR